MGYVTRPRPFQGCFGHP